MVDTPKRVAKAFEEWTSGYTMDPAEILKADFSAGEYDQMVHVGPIKFYSMCEHHLAPFHGVAHVAYVPGMKQRVVGLSKLARVVEIYGRRLQVQERMTKQILDALAQATHPKGVGVLIRAQHMCMCSRGVRAHDALTTTTALHGVFMKHEVRSEFLQAVERSER